LVVRDRPEPFGPAFVPGDESPPLGDEGVEVLLELRPHRRGIDVALELPDDRVDRLDLVLHRAGRDEAVTHVVRRSALVIVHGPLPHSSPLSPPAATTAAPT